MSETDDLTLIESIISDLDCVLDRLNDAPVDAEDIAYARLWLHGARGQADVIRQRLNTRTPPAADAEPVAWMYEHPAIGRIVATERWRTDDVTEMWTETPLYTAEQLQAYGDARAREMRERAAGVVRNDAAIIDAVAELQLAAFLAGRGSTRAKGPAPSMDEFRRMAATALKENSREP